MNRLLFYFVFLISTNALSISLPERLSQDFLTAVKIEQNPQEILVKLANLSEQELTYGLQKQEERMAFWLNIYNAVAQYELKKNTKWFDTKKTRSQFYGKKWITISGKSLSLDDIEHGLLRRNRSKFSLGYLNKLCSPSFIRKYQVFVRDARIHFCLNCGATSCPPILFYNSEQLNEQMNTASRGYLEGSCKKVGNTLEIPALFYWFRGDFGGKKGIYAFLERYQLIKSGERPQLKKQFYDWKLQVSNYE